MTGITNLFVDDLFWSMFPPELENIFKLVQKIGMLFLSQKKFLDKFSKRVVEVRQARQLRWNETRRKSTPSMHTLYIELLQQLAM